MNLYVNLILDSERRSSGRISGKFIIMSSVSIAVVIFALLIAFVLIGAQSAKNQLVFAEQEQKQLEPVFKTVNELKQELDVMQNLTNAISVWSRTRPEWPDLFAGLQAIVPPNIQLIRLTMNESFTMVGDTPARSVSIYLQGKATGDHSEKDVQELEKSLMEKPPFIGVVDMAKVKQFEAAKSAGQENMRIFDIECRFKAGKLFKPVAAQPAKSK